MRKLILVAPCLFLLGACTSTANVPPIVSWSYGAGNGDGVQYPGPPPKYSFAYGSGADVPVNSGAHPTMSYGYGAESTTGDTVQMTKPETQQLAAPAPKANSNTHS